MYSNDNKSICQNIAQEEPNFSLDILEKGNKDSLLRLNIEINPEMIDKILLSNDNHIEQIVKSIAMEYNLSGSQENFISNQLREKIELQSQNNFSLKKNEKSNASVSKITKIGLDCTNPFGKYVTNESALCQSNQNNTEIVAITERQGNIEIKENFESFDIMKTYANKKLKLAEVMQPFNSQKKIDSFKN